MNRRRLFLATLAALAWPALANAQNESENMKFGIVPYLPILQLARLYEPVVTFLEQQTGKPFRLYSAQDFGAFIARGRLGEFDVIAASPHVARLLNREAGYIPLVRATAPLEPVIVVPAENRMKDLRELAGADILVADPLAIHVLIPLRALREAGILPGKDVSLIVAGTQRNALQRLIQGEAAAAIASVSTLGTLPPDMLLKVRLLTRFPKTMTPMVYLLHPRHKTHTDKLIRQFMAFSASEEGVRQINSVKHIGFAPIRVSELAEADVLITEYFRQTAAK